MSVTLQTWGQGPGAATGLYETSDGTVRQLSPFEALRMHSFPEEVIDFLRGREDVSWQDAYRLAGNSIPILTLRDLLRGILCVVCPQAAQTRHGRPRER